MGVSVGTWEYTQHCKKHVSQMEFWTCFVQCMHSSSFDSSLVDRKLGWLYKGSMLDADALSVFSSSSSLVNKQASYIKLAIWLVARGSERFFFLS